MRDPANLATSKVRISSMIAIQVFDHKKYRKRDQGALLVYSAKTFSLSLFSGFLGVISISATEAITLAHQNGMSPSSCYCFLSI